TNRMPSASRSHTSLRKGVRAWSLTASYTTLPKSSSVQSRLANPTSAKLGDRRHQLLAGEVAGDPEDHHGARARDAGHALVPLVAQRVSPPDGCRRGFCAHGRHFFAASSCSWVAASSSCHDFSNFSTPSSSKTTNTSARSTPTASSLSNTACASPARPMTVSPAMTPWSATASMVFSGIVLTVFGATSSVTYRVSEYAGFLTPVDAHSGRCTRAPAALSAW